MTTITSRTMTNVDLNWTQGAGSEVAEKTLTIQQARVKLAELTPETEEYIQAQNALIKKLGITTISLRGINYKVYFQEEKLLGGFGAAEHVRIGTAVRLEGIPENAPLLLVANQIELGFGDIVALAGDFYGVPNQAISLPGGNEEAKTNRFMAAFNTLEEANPEELRRVLNEIEQECLQVANSALPHHCYSSQLIEHNARLTDAKKDYQDLLEDNSDHFSTQAVKAYEIGHRIALDIAKNSGRNRDRKGLVRSYAIEAFACHFLTDLFSSGHIRNQRGDLEKFLVKKLRFKEKRAKPLAAILTAAQHEKDGQSGVNVRNNRGNEWRSYGDGFFFSPQSEENRRRVTEATIHSLKEIYDAYNLGDTTSHMSNWLPVATDKNIPPLYKIEGKRDRRLFVHNGTTTIEITSKRDYIRKAVPLALSQLPESYITGFIKSKVSIGPPLIVAKVIFPILNEFTDVAWKSVGIASQAQVHQANEMINSKLDDMAELLKVSHNISQQILIITKEVVDRLEVVEIKQQWNHEFGEIRDAVASIMDVIHAFSINHNYSAYNANFQKYAEKMEEAYLRLSRVINQGTSSHANLIKIYKKLISSDNSKNPEMVKNAVTMWFRWLLDLQTKAFGIFVAGKIVSQQANLSVAEIAEILATSENSPAFLPIAQESRLKGDNKYHLIFPKEPNSINKENIASILWGNPYAMITEQKVVVIQQTQEYLKNLGYELAGTEGDGDCFFHAFLGSYRDIANSDSDNDHWSIPLLDEQEDRIAFLRTAIADQYRSSPTSFEQPERIGQIKKKKECILGVEEGGLLAEVLQVSIRWLTVNSEGSKHGFLDSITIPGHGTQTWDTIDPSQRPKKYIFIIDLGGHFVYAVKNKFEEIHDNADISEMSGILVENLPKIAVPKPNQEDTKQKNLKAIESMQADFEKNIKNQIKEHLEEINVSLIGKPLRYICLQYTNAKMKQAAFQQVLLQK